MPLFGADHPPGTRAEIVLDFERQRHRGLSPPYLTLISNRSIMAGVA